MKNTTIDGQDPSTEDFMDSIERVNTIAYFYFMPILLTTGIVSNLVNMYVLRGLGKNSSNRQKGSASTYMYLNWLALAQLLSCLAVIPSLFYLHRDTLSYSWAYYYGHFEIFFMNSLTSTSVYIIVGLSVDRVVAVCRPHSYQLLKGVRLASFRIAACFLVPPMFYTPLCFFQVVQMNKDNTTYTTIANTEVTDKYFWQCWTVAVELFHRLLPALLIVILNVCIIIKFKRIKSSTKKKLISQNASGSKTDGRNSVSQGSTKNASEQESRMFILLMGVIIVFLVSTLPAAYLGLTDSFGHGFISVQFEIFRAIANLLESLGFSLNFLLYFFLVPEVRNKLAKCVQKGDN